MIYPISNILSTRRKPMPTTAEFGYARIIEIFNKDEIAASFLREDGEGGFSSGVHRMAREIEKMRALLTHARDGGEVQNCEACGQWFPLEETISMDEGGWICKGCASSDRSPSDTDRKADD